MKCIRKIISSFLLGTLALSIVMPVEAGGLGGWLKGKAQNFVGNLVGNLLQQENVRNATQDLLADAAQRPEMQHAAQKFIANVAQNEGVKNAVGAITENLVARPAVQGAAQNVLEGALGSPQVDDFVARAAANRAVQEGVSKVAQHLMQGSAAQNLQRSIGQRISDGIGQFFAPLSSFLGVALGFGGAFLLHKLMPKMKRSKLIASGVGIGGLFTSLMLFGKWALSNSTERA